MEVMMPPVMAPPMMMVVMPVETRRSPISIRTIDAPVRDAMAPAIDVPTRAAAPADFGDGMRCICDGSRRKRLRCRCYAKKTGGEQCRCENLHLFLRAVGMSVLKNVLPERSMKRVANFGHICRARGGRSVVVRITVSGLETDH